MESTNVFLDRFAALGKDPQRVCWGIGIDSLAAALDREVELRGPFELSDAELLNLAECMETDSELESILTEQAEERLESIVEEFLDGGEPEEPEDTAQAVHLEQKTAAYNARRWGRPWIARVDFSSNLHGVFSWGDWVGQDGEAGVLVLDAREGEIVAIGQKDHQGHGTYADYYQIVDGALAPLTDKAAAYIVAHQTSGVRPREEEA